MRSRVVSNLWNEIQLKGPYKDRNRHKNSINEKEWAGLCLCQKHEVERAGTYVAGHL